MGPHLSHDQTYRNGDSRVTILEYIKLLIREFWGSKIACFSVGYVQSELNELDIECTRRVLQYYLSLVLFNHKCKKKSCTLPNIRQFSTLKNQSIDRLWGSKNRETIRFSRIFACFICRIGSNHNLVYDYPFLRKTEPWVCGSCSPLKHSR